jgi:hypothetical protein
MVAVPNDPSEFFQDWLPRHFAAASAGFGAVSSPGAVAFRIGERAPLSVRLVAGQIVTAPGVPADCIVQVALDDRDFAPILVRGAELLTSSAGGEGQLAVLKALTLDAERAELIRGVPGSVAFALAAPEGEHRVVLTPGAAARDPKAAVECVVRCQLADFLAMQRGEVNPFELMMNGKIQITGDAQIPMALSSLLV